MPKLTESQLRRIIRQELISEGFVQTNEDTYRGPGGEAGPVIDRLEKLIAFIKSQNPRSFDDLVHMLNGAPGVDSTVTGNQLAFHLFLLSAREEED